MNNIIIKVEAWMIDMWLDCNWKDAISAVGLFC